MISKSVIEALYGIVPQENVYLDAPMEKFSSFRVGGPADCLIEVENVQQLQKLQHYFGLIEMPFCVIGNGSNILVSDTGYRGIVLRAASKFSQIRVEGEKVIAQAGALMSQIAAEAMNHGLTGFEFASGIPGSIGGGVVMNAGAYGGEMKHVVSSVTVLDKENNMLELDNSTMEFGYRTSAIKNHPFIVTQVEISLAKGNKDEIKAKIDELTEKRRQKQPLEYPSAGSTFKRPEGYFAGQLIMESGMRGYQTGGARVSDKHCGFVVNTGNACAADIRDVIREVQEAVKAKFNVDLQPEVVMLGEF